MPSLLLSMTIPIRLLGIFFLFVASAVVCRANLGETEAQCIARYGPESGIKTDLGYRQVGDKSAMFTVTTPTGSLSVTVIFLHGLSCHEAFANTDISQGLTQDQMKGILESQKAGLKWDEQRKQYRTYGGTTYGTIYWRRSDGAVAKFYVSGKASSRSQTGQVELSTKLYATAQSTYDKENGD